MFPGEEFELSFQIGNPNLEENSENDRNISKSLKKLYQLLLMGVIFVVFHTYRSSFQIIQKK